MAHNRFMGRTEPNFASFDEPGLKAAVRRAWGSEVAPESLRAKVSCLRSDHVAASQVDPLPAVIGSIRPSFWQQPWLRYGFAAAAMMLLGFGIAYKLDPTRSGRSSDLSGTEVTFTSTVPPPVARELLESHER